MSARKWIRLDNAGKIYPAAKRRGWTALFRISALLTEPVDPDCLTKALACTLHRFENFSYKLHKGMFWYYMEKSDDIPPVQPDVANPCAYMSHKTNNGFCFRVRYYDRRIAVEVYHVLTDGTGGSRFLKTLVAEYLRIRYGADIPRDEDILDCTLPAQPGELDDGFFKYVGNVTKSRSEENSFRIKGIPEEDNVVDIITGSIPVDEVLKRAKAIHVSLTEYLVAVLILSVDAIQRREVKNKAFWKSVKINVPVNLRKHFPSNTLRNFSSYVNTGIDPKMGVYTLEEIATLVHHHMGMELNKKNLNAKFTTNVHQEKIGVVRIAPLFMKNWIMKMVFMSVGDKKSSTTISNLGSVTLPEEMSRYVTRLDFILGPLSINRVCCAAVSYNGMLNINFTRTLREPKLEKEFFCRLVKLGIPVKLESNQRR